MLPLIPDHEVYVEVFGGGASLLFSKQPAKVEVYNDRNSDLVNLFIVVRDLPNEFQERSQSLVFSRRIYREWMRELLSIPCSKIGDVDRAVKFYYAVRSAFPRGIGAGWRHARTQNHAKVYQNAISKVQEFHDRLRSVLIENLDFRKCIQTWDTTSTFFFLDPPYVNTPEYYGPFNWRDHLDLARALTKTQGKWLLTLNDEPQIRELYKPYPMTRMKTQLAVKKVNHGEKRPRYAHLVIRNYELPTTPRRRDWPS